MIARHHRPRGRNADNLHAEGDGGPQPVGTPLVRHPARFGLIFILLLMALALGTLVAAAWEAIDDMQARGQMDPTW
jgi:hypothetical protein